MQKYNPKEIENKWQKFWEKNKYGQASDFEEKQKHYHLIEFPYPSGEGLHVGHCMGYTASDVYARMKRMQGYNVMFPIGWDAFGLPTENFALKTGRKPAEVTKANTDLFRKQMKALAYSFDWSRELNTTDPTYYKWTQWIFLQFYKHAYIDGKLVEVTDDDKVTPRMAYQAEMPINWCPSCKIGLANEEVIDGKCERCGTETYKKMQKQWMLRITAYADRLIEDLTGTDYLEKIKTQQINWIGKSKGSEIDFKIVDSKQCIKVFTTRADTLFGCTYVVVAPESEYMIKLIQKATNRQEIENYIEQAKKKSDIERTELQKEKTGVKLEGVKAVNPINNEKVDVWVADYVLANYGTGAVMAVPAHDERDWEFAKKFGIEIKYVVIPREGDVHEDVEFRKSVSALVHRKSDDKYLMINWPTYGWISPISGGIESGEEFEEALPREVFEETGYKVRCIEPIGGLIESYFYADNKKVWRHRHDQHILCELVSEMPEKVDEKEKKLHVPIWLTAKEALEKISHSYNKIGLERYLRGNYANTEYGYLINSKEFDGLSSEQGKKKITEKLEKMGLGGFMVNFKLRDWVFSRQHYWGEPIPIIHCEKCGMVPMSEKDLPLVLPEVEKYEPTDTGRSPLAAIESWVDTTCPICGGKASRETDTMPNWAGSSWYYLAYVMNQNCNIDKTEYKNNIFTKSQKELEYWMPVDLYNGGMEHTTLHLLYSRFWHKFLYDLGCVNTIEPYQKRIAHGIILGEDGQKMSKSRGNVINPDSIVDKYGADTMRTYIMFIGPYDQESAWSEAGVQGVYRFLHRVWKNAGKVSDVKDSDEFLGKLNKYIVTVSDDIEDFRLNTYVAKLMEINNEIDKLKSISSDSWKIYLKMLGLAAPHIGEELWNIGGNMTSLFDEEWPKAEAKYLKDESIDIAVQVNGKVRGVINVKNDVSQNTAVELAKTDQVINKWLEQGEIVKVIYVPGKILSFVVK